MRSAIKSACPAAAIVGALLLCAAAAVRIVMRRKGRQSLCVFPCDGADEPSPEIEIILQSASASEVSCSER